MRRAARRWSSAAAGLLLVATGLVAEPAFGRKPARPWPTKGPKAQPTQVAPRPAYGQPAYAQPAYAQPMPILPQLVPPPIAPPPAFGAMGMAGAWQGEFVAPIGVAPSFVEPRVMLRARIGVERGRALLVAGSFEDRMRGIERLAADGSEDAIVALADALEPGSAVRAAESTRLACVRAIAPFALHERVRRSLEGVLAEASHEAGGSPLGDLARQTAALGLARAAAGKARLPFDAEPLDAAALAEGASGRARTKAKANEQGKKKGPQERKGPGLGSARGVGSGKDGEREVEGNGEAEPAPKSPEELALTPLLAAVLVGGDAGVAAREALLAFPPKGLDAFLRGERELPDAWIELFGDLGDVRAIAMLRRQLVRKESEIAARAAVALAKLGDARVAAEAVKWVDDGKASAAVRLSAVEALERAAPARGAVGLTKLLANADTRIAALHLAESWHAPGIAPTLGAVVAAKVAPEERRRAIVLLARLGTDDAVPALTKLLAEPEHAVVAGVGLARTPGPLAGTAVATALASTEGAARRMVLRVAIARWLAQRDAVAGLEQALSKAEASSDAADRAVAAYGLAVLNKRTVKALVASGKPELVHAAALASWVLGPVARAELGPLLEQEARAPLPDAKTDPELAQRLTTSATLAATSGALLEPAEGVPSSVLLGWVEGGAANAPLAAYRLATRDPKPLRTRLAALLVGSEPLIRAHVALGLGESPETDAVSRLAAAYRTETEVSVRRAIVRALSLRPSPMRKATLALAAELDADREVRTLAQAALAGARHRLAQPPDGNEVTWLSLVGNVADDAAAIRARVVWVERGDGLVLPMASAPDGVLLVGGLGRRGAVRFDVR